MATNGLEVAQLDFNWRVRANAQDTRSPMLIISVAFLPTTFRFLAGVSTFLGYLYDMTITLLLVLQVTAASSTFKMSIDS